MPLLPSLPIFSQNRLRNAKSFAMVANHRTQIPCKPTQSKSSLLSLLGNQSANYADGPHSEPKSFSKNNVCDSSMDIKNVNSDEPDELQSQSLSHISLLHKRLDKLTSLELVMNTDAKETPISKGCGILMFHLHIVNRIFNMLIVKFLIFSIFNPARLLAIHQCKYKASTPDASGNAQLNQQMFSPHSTSTTKGAESSLRQKTSSIASWNTLKYVCNLFCGLRIKYLVFAGGFMSNIILV